jgi:hypothetical protein
MLHIGVGNKKRASQTAVRPSIHIGGRSHATVCPCLTLAFMSRQALRPCSSVWMPPMVMDFVITYSTMQTLNPWPFRRASAQMARICSRDVGPVGADTDPDPSYGNCSWPAHITAALRWGQLSKTIQRCVPAELEGELLQGLRGLLHQQLARHCGAGQGDLAGSRVRGQQVADGDGVLPSGRGPPLIHHCCHDSSATTVYCH